MEQNIIESVKIASEAAAIAHDGQVRKNKPFPTPYIVHPARVAYLVSYYNDRCYMGIIAAWMHDIIEDCGERGRDLFIDALNRMPLMRSDKETIVGITIALTKDDNISPRAAKWQNSLNKLINKETPKEAILVKICDRIDNLMDLGGFKEGFVRVYLDETAQLIETVRNPAMIYGYIRAFNRLVDILESMKR